jgi:hypothetical protein
VSQIKLDDLVPTLKHVDFIKIDVEGAELEVLKGALELIGRNKPVLIIETLGEFCQISELLKKHYARIYVSHFGGKHIVCLPHD